MARISARLIGKELGKSAQEVNRLLEKLNFIVRSPLVTKSGSPTWDLTDIGKLHGELSKNPYSHGFIWDKEVVEIIKKTLKL
jgi:hypothetical protein